MTFRMARQFGSHIPLSDNRCYRVETEDLLTAEEARELMAQLGSPYGSERTPEMKIGPSPTTTEENEMTTTREDQTHD